MTPLLCTCAVVITLETQKCRKRAPRSVEFNFFINYDRQKRFSQNERRIKGRPTSWCSEIGSLASPDAPELHASSDVREPISLHQAVQNVASDFLIFA